jgi:hypothetical protein
VAIPPTGQLLFFFVAVSATFFLLPRTKFLNKSHAVKSLGCWLKVIFITIDSILVVDDFCESEVRQFYVAGVCEHQVLGL